MRMPLLCCALLLVATSVRATTADELVAKNLAARGGLDKIHAITTLKLEGKLRIGGRFDLAFTSYQKTPDSTRIEATIHNLLQSAAGQPGSREAAAARAERWAADCAAAREASQQAAVPARGNLGREAKG